MSRFITFEGGEGTGKSTQCRLLSERLAGVGIATVVTREPGGSPGAEIVRHVILSGAAKRFGPEAEAMLFAAARDDHIRTTIKPALSAGKWVLCDRFINSTRVYQGVAGNVDARLVRALERLVASEVRPDLTCILDLAPEVGLARAASRRGNGIVDRFEAEALTFHQRLRAAYRDIAVEEGERCVVVDAAMDAHAVADVVWRIVASRFGLAGRVDGRGRAP